MPGFQYVAAVKRIPVFIYQTLLGFFFGVAGQHNAGVSDRHEKDERVGVRVSEQRSQGSEDVYAQVSR